MTQNSTNQEHCCPKFDPAPWEEKEHVWKDKLFLYDEVRQIFHMPLNIRKVISRMWNKVQKADASPDEKDFLLLAYDPSPWKSELYMFVTKEVPDAAMRKLSGTYLTKVFDGPYNAVPKWIRQMDKYVKSRKRKVRKYYFYYTTCPKCAKIYGHNYAVTFAEVE